MDYKASYEKAKKEGKLQRQTSQIHTWHEAGESLIGLVKEITLFTGGKYDKPVNQYLIDTGDGFVSTILGSATDAQLKEADLVGRVIVITYEGKKDLGADRKVNIFNVDVVFDIEEIPEPKGEPGKGGKKNGK